MTNKIKPLKDSLNNLLQLYSDKKFDDAEQHCILITKEFPNDPVAYKLLAILLRKKGLKEEALNVNQVAYKLDPEDIETLNNLGIMYKDLGRLKEAEDSYRMILKLNSNFAEAYNNLGNILYELERFQESESCLRDAIELKPNFAEAYSNLGITLNKLEKLEEAEESHLQAIALNPNFAESYNELGVILQKLNQFDAAEVNYRKAIEIKSNHYHAYNNLGTILKKSRKLIEAKKSYEKAIALNPSFYLSHYNYANTLRDLGRFDEAERSYREALALNPSFAEAHNSLGSMLYKIGRLDEAKESLEQAIILDTDFFQAHNNLGVVFQGLGRLKEAELSFREAISLKFDYFEGHNNLLFLQGIGNFENIKYLKDAKIFSDSIRKKINHKFLKWNCNKEPKCLRVGFISGDFKNHPVGYFLEGLLSQLSSSSVELFAYSVIPTEDDLTSRIKPLFYKWTSLWEKNDKDAAQTINEDDIHILIDLSGHTKNNRLPIFVWKPAPIQISWLGYFASTGLEEVDYILGDPYVTPFSEKDHFIEKIWQLPESYLCFTPPKIDIDIEPLPALSNGFITYGSFNKLYKITDEVISVWARILKSTPNSKLYLKDLQLNYPFARKKILSNFAVHGISENYLILEGSSPRIEYLTKYNSVDIVLSPFPYGGGTTSVEALWMGVPFITKSGEYFLSHLGESIANNSGNKDFIAFDNEDYIKKAIRLSSNVNELRKLREVLRSQVLDSPLFNLQRFSNHFEKAVWSIWSKWKENNISQ